MNENGISLLAIDPGFTESAFVFYDGSRPGLFGKWPNATLLRHIRYGEHPWPGSLLVIEQIKHYGTGMPAGAEVFDTCVWSGKFIEAWDWRQGGDKFGLDVGEFLPRSKVKGYLCRAAGGNDGTVRQAVIDRFGGDSIAIGGRKCRKCKGKQWSGRERTPCDCDGGWQFPPGPLHEVTADTWQALALAVTYWDTKIQPLT